MERRQDLKEHLRNLKPSVLGQVETKVRVHNKQRTISYFPRHWQANNNDNHSVKGRIWLCWKPRIWDC